MTIVKHSGRLVDSEIVRSLEKIAVNKGIITKDPVMLKTASGKNSYQSTNNLHSDLIYLIVGLREKGYSKEADALEDKVHLRKMAATHLYRALDEDGEDLIDDAHPDGDAEVAPAKEDYGKVETIISQHKKILDKINKKPTGKYAELVLEILKSAQKISNKDTDDAKEWVRNSFSRNLVKQFLKSLYEEGVVDQVTWDGQRKRLTEEGEYDYLADKIYPSAKSLLENTVIEGGYDPEVAWNYIANYMRSSKHNYTESGTVVVFLAARTIKVLYVNKLWLIKYLALESGIKRGKIPILKDKVKKTLSVANDLVVKPIKDELDAFNKIRASILPQDNIDKATEIARDLTGIIEKSSQASSIEDVAMVLSEHVNIKPESINDQFEIQRVISILKNHLRKWREVLSKSKSYKEASNEILNIKIGKIDPSVPVPGVDKPGLPYKSPLPQQATPTVNVVLDIQKSLQELAKLLEEKKADPKDVSALRNIGSPPKADIPDGKWGNFTSTALGVAEKYRLKFSEGSSTPKLAEIKSEPAQSTLDSLRQFIESIKGLSLEKSYGTYNILGQQYEIKQSDVSSLPAFLRFLDRTGLINQITAPVIKQLESETSKEVTSSDEKLFDLVNKFSQYVMPKDVVDPWSAKYTAKPESPKPQFRELESGLTVEQWLKAIETTFDEVKSAWNNPEIDRVSARELLGRLANLHKQVTNVSTKLNLKSTDTLEGVKPSPELKLEGLKPGEGRQYVGVEGGPSAYMEDLKIPPIGNEIDLSNPIWYIISNKHGVGESLYYDNWRTTDAMSIASDLFGHGEITPGQAADALKDAARATPGVTSIRSDNQGIPKQVLYQNKWVSISSVPEIIERYKFVATDLGFRFKRFLYDLASEMSKVKSEWAKEYALKEPSSDERKRMMNIVDRSAKLWQNLIRLKASEFDRRRQHGSPWQF